MNPDRYRREIDKIVKQDDRYRTDAYYFISEAVAYATHRKHDENGEESRHISGKELLEYVRDYALEQYGPLALDVLEDWGVTSTEDLGAIVFHLVNHKLLGASEKDSPQDFAGGYDFRQTFLAPFAADRGPPAEDLPKIA